MRIPGLLIAIAIATAYFYSSAVVFGLTGKIFFWELATLVDIMLLGHWIEMKSVMGASRALEELARLMPSDAHKLMPDGSVKDVPLSELAVGDKVLVKPGEKLPADGAVVEGFVSGLSHLQASRFVTPKGDPELDVNKGALQVEITVEGEKEPLRLTVGKEDPDNK